MEHKGEKTIEEFKWSDIFAPPSGAIPSFFSIAPSAIGNEIKVVGWVKEISRSSISLTRRTPQLSTRQLILIKLRH